MNTDELSREPIVTERKRLEEELARQKMIRLGCHLRILGLEKEIKRLDEESVGF